MKIPIGIYQIFSPMNEGFNDCQIANNLSRDKSTIFRGIRLNTRGGIEAIERGKPMH